MNPRLRRQPESTPEIVGRVDEFSSSAIRGWAMIPNRVEPLMVELVAADQVVERRLADVFRPGVLERGLHETGRVGYEFSLEELPAPLPLRIEVRIEGRVVAARRVGLERLIYMHIPKTAGTSLNEHFGSYFTPEGTLFHAESHREQLDDRIGSLRLVSGHLRLIDWKRAVGPASDWITSTVVREPYAQLLSHLRWVKKVAEDTDSVFFRQHTERIQEMSLRMQEFDLTDAGRLVAFLQLEEREIISLFDNCQTRYFLPKWQIERLSDSDAESAYAAMDWFDHIGTTDDLESFAGDVGDALGGRTEVPVGLLNVQGGTAQFIADNQQLLEALKPWVRYDLELHRRVLARLAR
jgi:hypothetical protein